KLLAQRQLADLAGSRVRDLVEEHHVVGHPPRRNLAPQELQNLGPGDRAACPAHGDEQGPLAPFRRGTADHRCLGGLGVTNGDVLEFDRRDPFTARLDDILGAGGNVHEAVLVDGRDVARLEPPLVVQDRTALALVILAGDARAAYHEMSEGLAIAGQYAALVVHDAHFHEDGCVPLLELEVSPLLVGKIFHAALARPEAAQGAHLGHAPRMDYAHVVDFLELAQHGLRAGRTADEYALEVRQRLACLLQIIEQHQPYR